MLNSITLSARKKPENTTIAKYIEYYQNRYQAFRYPLEIESIFGFVEYSPMYGGRVFRNSELTKQDIAWMYDHGIGLRIPLQSFSITESIYLQNKHFLEKYHKEGNSLILVDDTLVDKIRNDFPKYSLEGSIIKKIDTVEKLVSAAKLYDSIVPDQRSFDFTMNWDSLSKEMKDKVRILISFECIYVCKDRSCYPAISKTNPSLPSTYGISDFGNTTEKPIDLFLCKTGLTRRIRGREISIKKYLDAGFTKFKATPIPARQE